MRDTHERSRPQHLSYERAQETEPLPNLHGGDMANGGAGESFGRNAIVVGSAFIASRLLGVIREIAIAARFGTSPDYDAYVAAFRIPDLLFLVVMSGAFGSAFIPVFAGLLARNRHADAWRLASAILSYTVLILGVVGLLTLLLANQLIGWVIAPGLPAEQQDLAANLTRLLLLSPLLLGIAIAFKGMLEAHERFALAAYAPVFYNAGIIFGAVALVPEFDVYGLAAGVVIGATLHASVQGFGLRRLGMRLQLLLDRSIAGFHEVARLMAPRIIGQAAFQVNFIVMTNFASREGTSSVGALNYAYQLFTLPYGVIALSVSTVIFPMMARQVELGNVSEMKATLSRALGPVIFLSLPAAVGLYAFRTPIVQVLFELGSFDEESTRLVAGALAYFALGLLGWAVIEAITRAFYALHDTRTPVVIAVSAVGLNIALSYFLVDPLGYQGLALAFSVASSIEAALLVLVLWSRIGAPSRRLATSVFKSSMATLAYTPFALWAGNHLARATDPDDGRSFGAILLFGYGLVTALAVYGVAAYVLRSPDLMTLLDRLPFVRNRISH